MILERAAQATIGRGPILHGQELGGGTLGSLLAQLQGFPHERGQVAAQRIQHGVLGHALDRHPLGPDPFDQELHFGAGANDATSDP